MMSSDIQPTCRPLRSEVGLLSRPDGSASVSHGDTSTLAAVYGPTQVRVKNELIDRAFIEVCYKAKVGLPSCQDKFRQDFLRDAIDSAVLSSQHPRTAINVIVQELQSSGSLLACAVNAAFLALLDAVIPLRFTVAAVTCAVNSQGVILLDPTAAQEEEATACMTFAFDSVDKSLVTSHTRGIFSKEQYIGCLKACSIASQSIFDFYREGMTKKISKSFDL